MHWRAELFVREGRSGGCERGRWDYYLRIEVSQVVGDSGIVVVINTNGGADIGLCSGEVEREKVRK